MKTFSMDLRQRIVAVRQEGWSAQDVAELFKVCKRTVERYWKQFQALGNVNPKRRGGYRRSRLQGRDKTLLDWIKQQPDLTLAELRERCRERLGVKIGPTALWQRLDKLGLSFKKNPARQRAKSARRARGPAPVEKRAGRLGLAAAGLSR
jgi:transposase